MKKCFAVLTISLAMACGSNERTLFVGTFSDGFYAIEYMSGEVTAKAGYQLTGPHPRNFLVTDDEVAVACRDNDSIEIPAGESTWKNLFS